MLTGDNLPVHDIQSSAKSLRQDPRSLERFRILDRHLGLEPIRRRLTDTLDIASSFGNGGDIGK
jgi:hypothetical protein